MARKYVRINSLKNFAWAKSKLNPEAVKNDLINSLADEGLRLIRLAYASRDWKNRTKNLKDSYVSAVFEDGKLVSSSVRFLSPADSPEATQAHTSGLRGREEAMFFLEEVGSKLKRQKGTGGLALVIAATMPYASILETPDEKWGYRVISHINTELQELISYGVTSIGYRAKYDLKKFGPSLYQMTGKYIGNE